ncbi:right-handed parallel beta-helix repeat-containing protein [Pseudoduganella lutea]|uniref:Right-handed parallel beta-helix repeat-containing protein n=1 Tax=Pseudoduganella lutea TaxID=321985 RepID=A0A4P6KS32_9BURK|nr:right-handed parallel beta-helix repeat-containing protein [Pseudoduganella lutea]QBE61909.1 right-handed parallel beta-helix repeat-containing protein [Pseudoduganella lutea]
MTLRLIPTTLSLLVSFAVSHAAFATEWHVAPNGDNSRDGRTPATAFRTLQHAESVVQPGDVVLLASGDYPSDPASDRADGSALLKITRSGRPDAWITWKAAPKARPVLHPRAWAGIQVEGSYHIIEGLTLVGANDEIALVKALEAPKKATKDPYYNTNGILVEGRRNGADSKPHHVVIRNNSVSKFPGGGITAIEADHVTVENNEVFDNAWFMEYGGSGITFLTNWQVDDAPGYHIVVRGNKVWNNRTMVPWSKIGKLSDGNGILLDVTDQAGGSGGATNPNADAVVQAARPAAQKVEAATATADPAPPPGVAKGKRPVWTARSLIANNLSAFNGGSGIHTFRAAHVDIVNNTTYWNGSVVDYQELFPNRSDDVVIMNNIIVPRPGGKVTSNNRNTNIRWDCNVYSAAQDVFKGARDSVADPLFVKVARDLRDADFRLKPGSAARDAGCAEVPQALDLAGRKRPQGKGRDRGAYEQ